MLNAIIRIALRYRTLIVALSLAALVTGGYLAARLPIDVFPDLDRPRVVVLTECAGMAPEEVERQVTFPLETAFQGATGVQAVRSNSALGLSIITVEFDWGANIYIARQLVQERLTAAAAALPAGLKPHVMPISSIMGQIMLIGLYRQPGPNGGALAPVERTPYLAELVLDQTLEQATVYVWDPRDAQQRRLDKPADWKPVAAGDKVLSLSWEDPKPGSLKLAPQKEGQYFRGKDSQLKTSLGEELRPRLDHRLEIIVKGRPHAVHWSTSVQDMELRALADFVVTPAIKKNGVAAITAIGASRKQYQVLVDPDAMAAHGVTLEEIETALAKNNLNASGGVADRGGREASIRVFGRLGPEADKVLAELRRLPVKQTPKRTVLIEQVARVALGPEFQRGDASINGLPGVVLRVSKQPGVDTRALTAAITQALNEVTATLPADIAVTADIFQMKNFIDRGIFNVGEALVIGAVLVLIVLFLFLLNFRTTFISLTAIPLSLTISVLTFKLLGALTGTELSINIMTLGGIAVAMGELVDDAIVDVENIFRRLRENRGLPNPLPAWRVIYNASVEIRSAIVFGTMMVILVFLPLFALSGLEGRLFTPLALAYIVSILASLLVSLTVTPVLSYYLLPRAKATQRRQDSPLLRGLKAGASHLIRLSMARPGVLLLTAWIGVGLSVWLLTRLGSDFLPKFDEGSVQVDVSLPPGASLQAANEVCAVVDATFRAMRKSADNPKGPILAFLRRSGRAELDDHVEPVGNSEYLLSINPDAGKSREEILQDILETLKGNADKKILPPLPGVDVEPEQPLAHLISHMLTGVTSPIVITIYGDDLDVLRGTAEKIKSALSGVPGLTPPVIEAQQNIEELQIRLIPEELAYHGIPREHAAHYVQLALKGHVVSQVTEGQRRFDVLVRLDEPFRVDFHSLDRLRVDVPGNGNPPVPPLTKGGSDPVPPLTKGRNEGGWGNSVLLGEIADIQFGGSANVINRENARRRLVIRANVKDRDLGSVVADIERRIQERVTLPTGYQVVLGGQHESQRQATLLLTILAGVAIVGMFLVLYMLFPSGRILLQILNALPTAFIGGVLALWLTKQTLTVAALVGFISLAGIAARNGILLVSHYFHLLRHEGETFCPDMVLRGSLERLSPVLMTALTAGIALLPLVLGGHQPGREILYPVATVILGGLVTSTLCEFLLHPGLFWAFSGRDVDRLLRPGEGEEEPPSVSQVTESVRSV